MAWMIGRTAALSNPEEARRKAAEKLRQLVEVDDPESLVFPILVDALLMSGLEHVGQILVDVDPARHETSA